MWEGHVPEGGKSEERRYQKEEGGARRGFVKSKRSRQVRVRVTGQALGKSASGRLSDQTKLKSWGPCAALLGNPQGKSHTPQSHDPRREKGFTSSAITGTFLFSRGTGAGVIKLIPHIEEIPKGKHREYVRNLIRLIFIQRGEKGTKNRTGDVSAFE